MTKEQLAEILTKHELWLNSESGGEKANLSSTDLRSADLSSANLSSANLRYADLRSANLSYANLSYANLRSANLSYADLRSTDLRSADLSYANGLLTAAQWLSQHFTADEHGLIVYKVFGAFNMPPARWEIRAGAVLTEIVNPVRCCDCACGINFGTLDWLRANVKNAVIWRCRIAWIDLADVVVPYNTDGKARCGRLTLLELRNGIVQ